MVEYGIPVISAIRKTAAPITGGMICPPSEAVTSMAAATWGLKPSFFIMGMVMEPVVTTLEMELPETVPIKALLTTEVLAGPPSYWPNKPLQKSIITLAAPVPCRQAPKRMNMNKYVEATERPSPKIPSSV